MGAFFMDKLLFVFRRNIRGIVTVVFFGTQVVRILYIRINVLLEFFD